MLSADGNTQMSHSDRKWLTEMAGTEMAVTEMAGRLSSASLRMYACRGPTHLGCAVCLPTVAHLGYMPAASLRTEGICNGISLNWSCHHNNRRLFRSTSRTFRMVGYRIVADKIEVELPLTGRNSYQLTKPSN